MKNPMRRLSSAIYLYNIHVYSLNPKRRKSARIPAGCNAKEGEENFAAEDDSWERGTVEEIFVIPH
jgi:hypothetical protein